MLIVAAVRRVVTSCSLTQNFKGIAAVQVLLEWHLHKFLYKFQECITKFHEQNFYVSIIILS